MEEAEDMMRKIEDLEKREGRRFFVDKRTSQTPT
jgi:hypothetical protein